MARKPQSKEMKISPSSSSFKFTTRKGLSEFMGHADTSNITWASKSGSVFQNSLTLLDYDCNPRNNHYLDKVRLLFTQLDIKFPGRIRWNKDDLAGYLDFVRCLSMQTAMLGKMLSVHGRSSQTIHQFTSIFETIGLGVTRDRNTDSQHGYHMNLDSSFTMTLHYDSLKRLYSQLVDILNTFPDPTGFKNFVWDRVRYFYKDNNDGDIAYFSFIPPLFENLMMTNGRQTIATASNGWGSLDSTTFLTHFEMLKAAAGKYLPDIISDVLDVLDDAGYQAKTISDDLDTWERYDEKAIAAVHNARLGCYFKYEFVEDTDSFDFTQIANYSQRGKSAAYEMAYQDSDERASTLIDSLDIASVTDYEYSCFSSMWFGNENELAQPLEAINGMALIYLSGEESQDDEVSYLVTFGRLLFSISPDYVASTLPEIKAEILRLSLLTQLKAAPPVALRFQATDTTQGIQGWTTWLWRTGNTYKLHEDTLHGVIMDKLDEMF